MPKYIKGMESAIIPTSTRIKFLVQGGYTQKATEEKVEMEDKIKHLNLISKQIYGKKYNDLNSEIRKEITKIYRKEKEDRGTVFTGKF